jgi:CIC family chloride channel protein
MAAGAAGTAAGRAAPPRSVGGRFRDLPWREPLTLVALALLTGVVGGLGAVVFRLAVAAGRWLFVIGLVGHALAFAGPARPWLLFLTPPLGLLLVGWISHGVAPEVRGDGVTQSLEALALRGGRLRPRVGLWGNVAAAITIGARGSVGREGPIALIGSSFGSSLGQLFRLNDRYTSLLLGCGAAAGIGATFNAPIAGALFGLEVVLGSYAMGSLVPVVIASFSGVVVFRAIWGSQLTMAAPAFGPLPPGAAAFVFLLGPLAAGAGLAATRGLQLAEEAFHRWRAPWPWQAILAGTFVGLLGLWLPGVLGVGYGTVHRAVQGGLGLSLLLLLAVGKYVATMVTVGAGGSGGVFAPSLYLGAMLGGAFGAALHALLPAAVPAPAVFAVVGLGAVFAAAAQAPLTAMVLILEMTGDYGLSASVMCACACSYFLYGMLARDSIYTVRLARRGIQVLRGTDVRPLQQVAVAAAMTPLGPRLRVTDTVEEAQRLLARAGASALPVFDEAGRCVGVADDLGLLRAAEAGEGDEAVGLHCRRDVPVLDPRLSLDDAMRRFGLLAVDLFPVGPDAAHVQGTLTRDDVLRAYHDRTALTLESQRRLDLVRGAGMDVDPGTFREALLPDAWPEAGLTLADLDLPAGAVVVQVQRAGAILVPQGGTRLLRGDRVLVYARDVAVVEEARRRLWSAARRRRAVLEEAFVLPAAGPPRTLAQLGLPETVLVVSVRHGDEVLLPRGDTVLHPGDTVVLRARDHGALMQAQALLARPPAPPAADTCATPGAVPPPGG